MREEEKKLKKKKRNLWIIPTDKPSRLLFDKEEPKQKEYWIGVVKWNDGTILRTQPFYKYDEGIKVWSSKFSYENKGKFESIDYEKVEEPKQELEKEMFESQLQGKYI